jgi:hypothetical protein
MKRVFVPPEGLARASGRERLRALTAAHAKVHSAKSGAIFRCPVTREVYAREVLLVL